MENWSFYFTLVIGKHVNLTRSFKPDLKQHLCKIVAGVVELPKLKLSRMSDAPGVNK